MQKINLRDIPDEKWTSPKGKYEGTSKEISLALGREPKSTDLLKRHPFDVEILHVAPGKVPYVYHSHSTQWEFYHVLAGRGSVRHAAGRKPIEAGDSYVFKPGEPHQTINDGTEELVIMVIADNPVGETCHYPDSNKWVVQSPERRLIRSEPLDYFDGEE